MENYQKLLISAADALNERRATKIVSMLELANKHQTPVEMREILDFYASHVRKADANDPNLTVNFGWGEPEPEEEKAAEERDKYFRGAFAALGVDVPMEIDAEKLHYSGKRVMRELEQCARKIYVRRWFAHNPTRFAQNLADSSAALSVRGLYGEEIFSIDPNELIEAWNALHPDDTAEEPRIEEF